MKALSSKRNDPTEAATSTSGQSPIPYPPQDQKMNKHTNSTAAAVTTTLISRRGILGAGLAISAASAAPTYVFAAHSEAASSSAADAPLYDLISQFAVAQAELGKAKSDLEWLVDEWRHRWPLAPEEILRGVGRQDTNWHKCERDIAGRLLERETASLTHRFTKEWREKHPRESFHLVPSERLAEQIADVRSRPIRTPAGMVRQRKQQEAMLRQLEKEFELAKAYEEETERLRELSGVEDLKARIRSAEQKVIRLQNAVYAYKPKTTAALHAKADFVLRECEAFKGAPSMIGLICGFAEDILRLRDQEAAV